MCSPYNGGCVNRAVFGGGETPAQNISLLSDTHFSQKPLRNKKSPSPITVKYTLNLPLLDLHCFSTKIVLPKITRDKLKLDPNRPPAITSDWRAADVNNTASPDLFDSKGVLAFKHKLLITICLHRQVESPGPGPSYLVSTNS